MRLGDCCKTNLHTYSDKEKWSLIRYLDTGSITEGRIDEIQTLYPGADKIPSRARRKASVGDILFSTVRPNQKHYGIIEAGTENLLVSTGFTVVTVDTTIADPYFIYYYLTQSSVIESLQAIAEQSTSTYPSIKPSDIEDIELDLPELETQKKIGSTLRMLDRKIALNEEINDNLEQQAKELFRAWFVEFIPFGGTMPSDWHFRTLGESTEMSAGGDKPKILSSIQTEKCTYPVYSNGLSDEGLYGYTDAPKIKDESVTVSARGTIGFVCLRHIPYVPIVRLVTLIPLRKLMSAKYLYLYLKQCDISGTGTTQQQLTVPDFRKTEILIPSKDVMDQFTKTVTPLFDTIWSNQEQNRKLASLRDILLPKLMSGELNVSDIQL